ncbi:MAG: hypothetical protein QOJ03_1872 [Frankiaceae bacterium]|jgi:hypothetical protein|nr:hypothetical protein [Frankiaceae bacterium]
MTSRWERLAPLTGVLAIAVILIGVIVIGGNTPDTNDPATKILSFYKDHRDKEMGAAFITGIGGALFVFFSASMRALLSRPPARGRLAAAAFGGGIVTAAGILAASTIHLALADSGKHGTADVAQALAYLDNSDYLVFGFGLAAMVLPAGISIVRTRVLPLWLGIVAIVAGVVSFTPFGFFGFLLALVWVIVVSIWLAVRPVADTTALA